MKIINKISNKIYDYVPRYAIVPLMLCVTFNFSVYWGVRLFYDDRIFHDLTTYLDEQIPLLPIFVVIYLGSYAFWITNYILISRINKEQCYRLITADLLGKLICGLIYILYPTTNIRPDMTSTGIFVDMLKFLYSIDAANNLFPSIHCLVSWYCYAGIRNCKAIPKWYRCVSLIVALMICISTVTTKQHVIVDVFGGVMLAEITWQLSLYLQVHRAKKLINQEA